MPLSRSIPQLLLILSLVALCAPPAVLAQQTTTQDKVDELLAIMAGDDRLGQERAAQELAELGSPLAVPGLEQIFLTSDAPRPAATALASIGTRRALRVLISALGDEALTPRRNAAQIALLEVGEGAVPSLLSRLYDNNPAMRRNVAELLGFVGSPKAALALLRRATVREEPEVEVRLAAVWALGELDAPWTRGLLQAISHTDPDPAVRAEALRAMLRVGEVF